MNFDCSIRYDGYADAKFENEEEIKKALKNPYISYIVDKNTGKIYAKQYEFDFKNEN